mmetsp:Transcript_33486/g.51420  ORF Transcript_33486/g.51420 Transcript_33486/m.51420 type:complete len:108 (+) Transcript_33486:1476-1799(+)
MIERIREGKDRELKRIKDRFDDERRKESEKYQFEYDKLREEIQLIQRKLGQEENMNKQLSVINYKLQNNLKDIGKDFYNKDDDFAFINERPGVKKDMFYPSRVLDID